MKLNLIRRTRQKQLPRESLLRLCQDLSLSLRGGKDLTSSLKILSEREKNAVLKDFILNILSQVRVDSVQNAAQSQKQMHRDPVLVLFWEILFQAQKGTQHLSQLLVSYSQFLRICIRLEKQQKSMLFLPKFQAAVGIMVALFFSFGMPQLSPDLFPSFLQQGRWDLFATGIGGVGLGIFVLHLMSKKPKKYFYQLLQTTFFFQLLGLLIECGLDFITAWKRTIEEVPLDPDLKLKLSVDSARLQTVGEFLTEKENFAPEAWRPILRSISWIAQTGMGLSQFIKQQAAQQTEDIAFSWEDEVRKLAAVSVLPVSFLIFPSAMFLLVGPRLLELMGAWS